MNGCAAVCGIGYTTYRCNRRDGHAGEHSQRIIVGRRPSLWREVRWTNDVNDPPLWRDA